MQSCRLVGFDGALGSDDMKENVTIRGLEVENSTMRINQGNITGFMAKNSRVVFTTAVRDVAILNATSDTPVICGQRSGPWARLGDGVEFNFDLMGDWGCLWHYMFGESWWRVLGRVEGIWIMGGFAMTGMAVLVCGIWVEELGVGDLMGFVASIVSTVINLDGIVKGLYRLLLGLPPGMHFMSILPLLVAIGCFGVQVFISVRYRKVVSVVNSQSHHPPPRPSFTDTPVYCAPFSASPTET